MAMSGPVPTSDFWLPTSGIAYRDHPDSLSPEQLRGFFVGWPNPPSPEAHLRILRGSAAVEVAIDEASGAVVGFVTAISDGVSCAYIPHLEVLPAYQGRGIGTALLERLLARLRHLYMIDLTCDPEVQPFYARLGLRPSNGMLARNYDRQACDPIGEEQ
jgi:ribosomal protein S18 acetylase RimI-like enzyme